MLGVAIGDAAEPLSRVAVQRARAAQPIECVGERESSLGGVVGSGIVGAKLDGDK